MGKKEIDRLVRIYGDRWILRDLDFFPEKLSDACRIYPYTVDTFMEVVEGDGFVSFHSEKQALDACMRIYENVLKKKVPYGLLERYYKVDSGK